MPLTAMKIPLKHSFLTLFLIVTHSTNFHYNSFVNTPVIYIFCHTYAEVIMMSFSVVLCHSIPVVIFFTEHLISYIFME